MENLKIIIPERLSVDMPLVIAPGTQPAQAHYQVNTGSLSVTAPLQAGASYTYVGSRRSHRLALEAPAPSAAEPAYTVASP